MSKKSDAEPILRRVGTVLIIVGLLDIGYMVYFFATGGSSYSSSFNIIAVVAGFFIRKGNLRVVQFSGFFVRYGFLGVVVGVLMAPIIFPTDLVKTFLIVTPMWKLLGWSAFVTLTTLLLWWLDKNLQSGEVRALLREENLHKRWPRLVQSFKTLTAFSAALAVVIIVLFQFIEQTDTAKLAISKAHEEFGSEFSYHLSAISVTSSSNGRSVSATVIAYTESEIQTTHISWQD